MVSNVLITGAAGYIGGSLLSDFLARENDLIAKKNIFAAVKSEEQAGVLSKLGITVLVLDLANEDAVVENILQNEISIVINTASSLNPRLVLNLVTALAKRKDITGEQMSIIHTSGLSAFMEKTGWPPGQMKDTDQIFEVEKKFADSFPLRKTDVSVIEHAEATSVTSYVVVPPIVYGRGTGEWNQLSVLFPLYIQALISRQAVYKFPENTTTSGVHISDLTALYRLIVEKILQKEPLSSGTKGYYFALAHDISWWELLDHMALALEARGLVTDSKVRIWPSDEAVAEAVGIPVPFVQTFWNSGENIISDNRTRLGWAPAWDKDRFLHSVDDEIKDVLELGKAKSSLVDSIFDAVK